LYQFNITNITPFLKEKKYIWHTVISVQNKKKIVKHVFFFVIIMVGGLNYVFLLNFFLYIFSDFFDVLMSKIFFKNKKNIILIYF